MNRRFPPMTTWAVEMSKFKLLFWGWGGLHCEEANRGTWSYPDTDDNWSGTDRRHTWLISLPFSRGICPLNLCKSDALILRFNCTCNRFIFLCKDTGFIWRSTHFPHVFYSSWPLRQHGNYSLLLLTSTWENSSKLMNELLTSLSPFFYDFLHFPSSRFSQAAIVFYCRLFITSLCFSRNVVVAWCYCFLPSSLTAIKKSISLTISPNEFSAL